MPSPDGLHLQDILNLFSRIFSIFSPVFAVHALLLVAFSGILLMSVSNSSSPLLLLKAFSSIDLLPEALLNCCVNY